MKAIIYTRFSPRKNSDKSESCEVQEGICRHFASEHELEVVDVLHDKDISGKDEYREKLWQAIDGLIRGGVLLVFKRDRLARNVYLSEQINRAVASRGAAIVAVSGDVAGDGPEQVMVRQILASIAEFERKMIGSRTSYAMKQHQRNGRRMGRYAPYGSRVDPDNPTMLELDPVEMEAVDMIKGLLVDTQSPAIIVKAMNEVMPHAARAGKWNFRTVKKIMKRL